MLSSGTAGRATDLLLTITLVWRRGKYGPRSPERYDNIWLRIQHMQYEFLSFSEHANGEALDFRFQFVTSLSLKVPNIQ